MGGFVQGIFLWEAALCDFFARIHECLLLDCEELLISIESQHKLPEIFSLSKSSIEGASGSCPMRDLTYHLACIHSDRICLDSFGGSERPEPLSTISWQSKRHAEPVPAHDSGREYSRPKWHSFEIANQFPSRMIPLGHPQIACPISPGGSLELRQSNVV
jgi:hypothetical protein